MLLPLFVQAEENQQNGSLYERLVHKTSTCGCCKKWLSLSKNERIVAYSKDYRSIRAIKNKYGIKPYYRSCHTVVTRVDFAFEGHLSAMSVDSPGMEIDRFMPYKVLIRLKDHSSKVYEEVNTYEEQF